jgi:hypothetical protein
MCRDLVTALRSFARHQAESQPDDAPYEPGGVLSIPDSSFWFTAGHAGGASPAVALKETAAYAACQAAARREVVPRPGEA